MRDAGERISEATPHPVTPRRDGLGQQHQIAQVPMAQGEVQPETAVEALVQEALPGAGGQRRTDGFPDPSRQEDSRSAVAPPFAPGPLGLGIHQEQPVGGTEPAVVAGDHLAQGRGDVGMPVPAGSQGRDPAAGAVGHAAVPGSQELVAQIGIAEQRLRQSAIDHPGQDPVLVQGVHLGDAVQVVCRGDYPEDAHHEVALLEGLDLVGHAGPQPEAGADPVQVSRDDAARDGGPRDAWETACHPTAGLPAADVGILPQRITARHEIAAGQLTQLRVAEMNTGCGQEQGNARGPGVHVVAQLLDAPGMLLRGVLDRRPQPSGSPAVAPEGESRQLVGNGADQLPRFRIARARGSTHPLVFRGLLLNI